MANKKALVLASNGDIQQIQDTDSLIVPDLTVGPAGDQSTISAFTKAGGMGIWYNLPTTGPSGIGTNGAGNDAWLGYCFAAGNWCSDSLPGDLAYRNLTGRLIWGTSIGPMQMSLSSTGLDIVTPVTIPTPLTTADIRSAVNIEFLTTKFLQKFDGNVAQMSNNSKIPFDNTVPLITEGLQVWSQTVTPTDNTKSFQIKFAGMCDSSSSNNNVIVAIFRDSTFIGLVSTNISTSGRPENFSLIVNDSPATAVPVVYSCRIGGSATATWYLGRASGATFGGVNNSGWTIDEVN
jgi:hypothetical protein